MKPSFFTDFFKFFIHSFKETFQSVIRSSAFWFLLILFVVVQISSWIAHRSDKALQEDLKWEKAPDNLGDIVDITIQANNQQARIEQAIRSSEKTIYAESSTQSLLAPLQPQIRRPTQTTSSNDIGFREFIHFIEKIESEIGYKDIHLETLKGLVYLGEVVEKKFKSSSS